MSDNGPQYDAECFREFTATYGFTHVTSSPIYPQGNGEVERAIRTAKALLKKNDDFHNALLIYRPTPRQNGLSPRELLMGRRLRTQLPVHPVNLQPSVTTEDRELVERKEASSRRKQQNNFDKRHRAKDLAQLKPGDAV